MVLRFPHKCKSIINMKLNRVLKFSLASIYHYHPVVFPNTGEVRRVKKSMASKAAPKKKKKSKASRKKKIFQSDERSVLLSDDVMREESNFTDGKVEMLNVSPLGELRRVKKSMASKAAPKRNKKSKMSRKKSIVQSDEPSIILFDAVMREESNFVDGKVEVLNVGPLGVLRRVKKSMASKVAPKREKKSKASSKQLSIFQSDEPSILLSDAVVREVNRTSPSHTDMGGNTDILNVGPLEVLVKIATDGHMSCVLCDIDQRKHERVTCVLAEEGASAFNAAMALKRIDSIE